jgi:PAS domain S-box-containing protein
MQKDAPPRELGILFERNPVPMLVADIETLNIVEANQAALRQYGYSRDEFLGMNLAQIRPAEDVPLLARTFAPTGEGVMARGSFRHTRRDGGVLDVEVSTEDLVFGGRPSRLIVAVDVTAQKQAAHRLERLQSVTAALSQAWTTEQVADAVVGRGVDALGARSGALAMLGADGELHLVKGIGYPREALERYRRIPLDTPFPLSDAVREGEPIFLAGAEERAARYPHLAELRQTNGQGPMAAVPLLHDGRTVGVLGLNFPDGAALGDDERAFVRTLAQQCSQALARVQAHEAAEMERRRLAAVLDAIPIGVWIADGAGAVTHVNDAAGGIFGEAPLSPGIDAYGDYRGWWPETGLPVQPREWALARAITQGEVTVGELLEIERADGSRGFILNSAAPIRDGGGELVGGVVTALDVTARVRAEAERDQALAQAETARDRLRRIFQQAPVAIATTRGPDHVLETVNAAYLPLLGAGHRAEELLGRPAREAVPEFEGQGFFELLDQVYSTGQPFIGTEVPARVDRGGVGLDEVFYNFVYQPLMDAAGRVEGLCAVAVDVTALVRARQAAEDANQAKSDFLASMSHELRTPLNAIGGYVELIQLGLRGPVTDTQQQDLERIQRSQRHLLSLVNDVLNFARLEAGAVRFQLEDLPVARALAEVDDYVAPQVRARGVRYSRDDCQPGLAVRADAEKLKQVLLNLLTNALKFTPAEGEIEVRCAADEGCAAIRVCDTGCGIAAEKLPFIFDPFVQAGRALHRPQEGVGLGLAISRDLARGMGGELMVESVEGQGSTFILTLPLAPSAAAPVDAAVAPGVRRI